MDSIYSPSRTTTDRIRKFVVPLILLAIFHANVALAEETWQEVEARSWVEVDTPPGWILLSEKNETTNPENVKMSVIAPDTNTRLTYILEHTRNNLKRDEIQKFQSGYMSRLGFRICKTKDPIVEEKDGTIVYRQTYVRGTGDAAVIGTLVKPGWGQAHYILVMEGPQAVADYYESIPILIQDHITPISPDETEE